MRVITHPDPRGRGEGGPSAAGNFATSTVGYKSKHQSLTFMPPSG